MTKGPLSLCGVGGPSSLEVSDLACPLPYQSRAIMMVNTRMVVAGLSGASAP